METLREDLRFGLRRLRRSPGFAAAVILALAGGIGANTALFSLVDAILIRPLPFADTGRLAWIWSTRPDRDRAFFSIPNFEDYRRECGTFERLGAFAPWSANLTGAGDTERIVAARLTPEAFDLLGVRPRLGRLLEAPDGAGAGERVAVVTQGFFARRLGGDAGALGRSVVLNGDPYTVVGVLPSGFFLPNAEPGTELFVPLALDADPRHSNRGANFLRAFGRLAPGATPEEARSEMAAIAARLRERHPDENAGNLAPRVVPIEDEVSGPYRGALLILFGSVGAVLLIACANLAGLQVARAAGRRREIAVRAALGATRARLVRQLLAESLLIALLGGGLGMLLASWAVPGLLALGPADLPRADVVGLDGRALLFTLALSIVAGLATGFAPAWRATRHGRLAGIIGAGRSAGPTPEAGRAQAALVIAEVAVSLTLLVGAGLLVKSFARLMRVSPGIEADGVLTARVGLPGAAYGTVDKVGALHDELMRRVRALPGVRAAGLTSVLPVTNVLARADFMIAGKPPLTPAEMPSAQNRAVSAGYFATLGIPRLAGRDFEPTDDAAAPAVAIVDATLARRHFPRADPVGGGLRLDDGGGFRDVTIVGVVGAVTLAALKEPPAPTIYVPFTQLPPGALGGFTSRVHLVVKSDADPHALEHGLREALRAADADVSLSAVRTMRSIVDEAAALRRFNLTLMSLFAAAAVLLAASGLYALLAGTIAARTREIAIRMALGARRADVLCSVVGRSARLAFSGLALGALGSLALARLLAGLLYDVRPGDPWVVAGMTLLLGVVTFGASLVPALRATRVDPAEALRAE